MKIYTKTGDMGQTSMIGKRVGKNCLEMEAIGEIDELNAWIGLVIFGLGNNYSIEKKELLEIQSNLFVVGSNLASVQSNLDNIPKLSHLELHKLEKSIDKMEEKLPTLKNFILPGGNISAAQIFLIRTICRRAERRVVEVQKKYPKLDNLILSYLNRLSDYFFVLARFINYKRKVKEIKWITKK